MGAAQSGLQRRGCHLMSWTPGGRSPGGRSPGPVLAPEGASPGPHLQSHPGASFRPFHDTPRKGQCGVSPALQPSALQFGDRAHVHPDTAQDQG